MNFHQYIRHEARRIAATINSNIEWVTRGHTDTVGVIAAGITIAIILWLVHVFCIALHY